MSSRVVAIVTLAVTHGAERGPTFDKTRRVSPDFRRGGMAEWSMAVVLKTSPIGYPKRLYFGGLFALKIGEIRPQFARSRRFPSPT